MFAPLLGLALAIPSGPAMVAMDFDGTKLEVFTYKPASYTGKRMIMVLHGTLRNAEEYRDHAQAMGDRFGALIVAPLFDVERFPSIRYQRGGILRPDGTPAPSPDWTYAFIPKIAGEIRRLEGRKHLPFSIIGHSAGGQFVVRMAGFYETGATRMVAANPGSLLFPRRDWGFGYGFGNLPAELATDDVLRRYLAQPLTLYVGSADNKPDEYFDDSPEAMLQGAGRYQRSLACFDYAKTLAKEKGWKFNWTLVTARMIEHDHTKMFNHPASERALFGSYNSLKD